MTKPSVELREYLEALVGRVLAIKSIARELRSSLNWRTGERKETYKLGAFYLDLAAYSMSRILLVELAALMSPNEERSLVDFLSKAGDHAKQLDPTREHKISKQRETVSVSEYRAIIDNQLDALRRLDPIIGRIKARRDKSIVHFDKRYFDNSQQVYKDFPLDNDDIDSVLAVIDDVLISHHSLLLESGISTDVVSAHTLETLMRSARAFQKARQDRSLIANGFRPADYLND